MRSFRALQAAKIRRTGCREAWQSCNEGFSSELQWLFSTAFHRPYLSSAQRPLFSVSSPKAWCTNCPAESASGSIMVVPWDESPPPPPPRFIGRSTEHCHELRPAGTHGKVVQRARNSAPSFSTKHEVSIEFFGAPKRRGSGKHTRTSKTEALRYVTRVLQRGVPGHDCPSAGSFYIRKNPTTTHMQQRFPLKPINDCRRHRLRRLF